MNKKTRRLLSLLLLFSLLVGILPLTGVLGAAAAENGSTVTEEERELPAATEATPATAEEETPTETESETEDPSEEPAQEEEDSYEVTEPAPEIPVDEEDTDPDPDKEPPADEEAPEVEPQAEEIRAGSYGLQIPMILYGTSTFSVSFKYPGDPSQTTYTVGLSGFRYHYLNGKMAYCLEPQAGSTAGAVYSQIAGGADLNVWDQFLSTVQQNAIALALAYGAPNRLNSSNSLTKHGYEAATQVIIWELIIGYRSSTKPFSRSNAGLYNFVLGLCNPNDSTGTLRSAFVSAYSTILASMGNHGDIPSFGSRWLNSAPTYEMAYDSAAGVYKVILTDTNNVINNDFPYTNGNGLTFSKSGNKLTVTATAAALQNAPVSVTSVGSNPDVENASPVIWGTSASNHTQGQILCQMAEPDPVHCYFKLAAPTKSTLTIQKVSADGNISGITFTVKDSAGSTLFTGQTDAAGKLDVPNLEVGATVTVTETVPENYVCENRTQTITLAAGTNTLTFRNYPVGDGTMQKTAEDGDVEGYYFRLYRHKDSSAGITGKTWCGRSDADGNIYLTDEEFNDLPGERNYTFTDLTDGQYSLRELLSMYGAGEVQTESITIQTSGGVTEACDLVFTGETLHVGDNGDAYVSAVPLTGLTGGGHLTITVHNKPVLTPGSITVKKVDPQKQPLTGAVFLLEYSTDNGTNWAPVFSRDTESEPAPGGCTSEGLADGTLTTGADGLAAFTGLFTDRRDISVRYRMTEIKTAPGYSLLTEPVYEGTLSKDMELDLSYTVVNVPAYEMPMTGGIGFRIAALAAALAVLSGAVLWIAKRRKNRR